MKTKGWPLVILTFLSSSASFVCFAPGCCGVCNDDDKTIILHIKRIVQHSQGALSWLHLIPFLAVSARQSEDVFLPHKLLSPALGLECVL